ncbi:MAG: twin-arginine translocase subunit TatC [Pyrinomonadaceae bacterium]
MSAVFPQKFESHEEAEERELGGQMSFLEHLDEFRRRLVRSVAVVFVAFLLCWFVSRPIYNFLARPAQEALAAQTQLAVPVEGLNGDEKILLLDALKEGDAGRLVFDQSTKIGVSVIPPGATVLARVANDKDGNIGLFTDEPLFTGNTIIPKGVRLPFKFEAKPGDNFSSEDRMIVTTALEPFTLYAMVALYAAIGLSVPFLLLQIWGFVSPALYKHERGYITPFIGLSTISFLIGAAFAYYVLLPPALTYLIGLGQDFRVLLRASDYFDFVTILMLAMGLVFQMPAITYVLARIGIINAWFLVRAWRTAIVVILIVAAVASPTTDVPNMMLFAAPMIVLYIISIFIAWIFGKKRVKTEN